MLYIDYHLSKLPKFCCSLWILFYVASFNTKGQLEEEQIKSKEEN